jgi:glucuronosyltransferase
LWSKLYYGPITDKIFERVLRKYFPELQTSPDELRNSVQLLFINTHPALGFVRPITPKTIQLGFMQIEKPKPLPTDLKKFLDDSENGVIYMSLGSNVRSSDLNPAFIDIFRNVFKSLKYDVIWKFENENLSNKPKNVKISKWLPQLDLLAHPKIKLFIMQGGQVRLFIKIS